MIEEEKNPSPVQLTAEEIDTLTSMQGVLKEAFETHKRHIAQTAYAQAATSCAQTYAYITTILSQSRKGPQ